MNNPAGKTPTIQSLAARLKPDTGRKVLKIFGKFESIDKDFANEIVRWAYELGKADAITEVRVISEEAATRLTSIFKM